MLHLKRISRTYYARFIIPKDRWDDCGRREVVRTLQTQDHKVALQRRRAALHRIEEDLNAQLTAKGQRPLTDGWSPSWQETADRAGDELRRASPVPFADYEMAEAMIAAGVIKDKRKKA